MVFKLKSSMSQEIPLPRFHKSIPPQQFSFLEFCFPLFLVDGLVASQLLPLKPAWQRLVW
jgi:hypothetical protein